ncbi:U32 family peptidase [Clostridium bovifaecis]|uniref:U32 family peptidase n=1 Tax=Clostridium bovifaecis TaxID=2184719 RepID=A0A6I6F2T5_9CLOT|nr:U32 family peptidase [Clostridium bovifaecis]
MNKIELLAPAGSMDSLHAAVQNGADAVYLGGAKFSARAYASNFDEENMIKAVEYCHLYNIKIYVTVNTLLKESEIIEALEYTKFLYEIGVDALIIQDTGLAELVRRNFPNFEIHASTQMTVHNGEGALFLKNSGFSRIVLSRELSLEEIKYISKDLEVETEIFVHGALCICYSGQCLMSSLIGGRSGNRGRCAQPCRLPYNIINKKTGQSNKGYILSPKDICTIENVKELIESGTSSLKIEGRMKRPEYVAGVVSAYRKAIDAAYEELGVETEKINRTSIKDEKKKLLQLFNREGFSKAYMFGNVGKDMMAYNFPKNTGILLGKVNKDLTIKLEENISLQDGVRFDNDGFTVFKIVKGSKNVEEAYRGDLVKLKPTKYKAGDMLYKTSDTKLFSALAKSYENVYGRKNLLELTVKFKVGKPIVLSTNYNNKEYEAIGDEVQTALNKPMDKEKLAKNLNKTGDTVFQFARIHFSEFEEGFLPVSSINAVRRELVERIIVDLKNSEKKSFEKDLDFNINKHENATVNTESTMVVVTTKEQLKAVEECGIENIAVELFMRNCDIDLERVSSKEIYIKTPSIVKGEFEAVCKIIEKNLLKIKGIITSNLGLINRFKGKTQIIGDYKLNLFNSYSLRFYNRNLQGATISLELNKKEIQEFIKKVNLPCTLFVYGKPELMVSEYCPIGSVFGGQDSKNACKGECNKGSFVLRDRKGEEMAVNTDKFCRSHIYNSSPINLIPNLEEIKKINISSFRLDFIDESYEEVINIIRSFKEGKFEKDFNNYTRGHFKRGVE